jgi:hypothetical protein
MLFIALATNLFQKDLSKGLTRSHRFDTTCRLMGQQHRKRVKRIRRDRRKERIKERNKAANGKKA